MQLMRVCCYRGNKLGGCTDACGLAQEASKVPNGRRRAVSKGSIDAAGTAQIVRHLEEDPLIQLRQDAGGLPVMDTSSDNLTNGLRPRATPSARAPIQLPIMTQDCRSKVMSILWANWEVIAMILQLPCGDILHTQSMRAPPKACACLTV